ncbi:nuclear transport factor 2 family protein [Deltaproteobacteria bacterium]|nr:nuclear transport factor 2 family protein [Deltaproteobacteria bacterium]
MKTRFKYFLTFFACLIIASYALGGCTQQEVDNSQAIEAQKLAQRALDVHEVQNVMSKHQLIRDNIEELNTIWVRQDGPNAKTAKWTQPQGIWEGMESIMSYYGTAAREGEIRTLEAISELYPEIKVVPENYGIGDWGVNSPTNPVIEIAGDGKTAKGLWESNGPYMSSSVVDGKVAVHGTWFWRTYAVDFMKEDGQWKIWHMNIVYDISTALDAPYGMDYTKYQAPERDTYGGGGTPGLPAPTGVNPNPYRNWSPTRVPERQPRIPEPYYTFSETFSY